MHWLAALALMAAPVAAQTPAPAPAVVPDPAVAARAGDLIPFLNGGGSIPDLFAPELLAAVPEAQLRSVTAQLVAALGKAERVGTIDAKSATGAVVTIAYANGTARFGMAVSPAGKIIGLRVLGNDLGLPTMAAVADALKALPGQTGFALAELGSGAPRLTAGIAPDRPLALGSAFKLVVLATLARDIEAARRHWEDTVTLDGTELPAGGFNQKPKGTQVTLRLLAEQMISISDNSATDILIATLGRAPIEAMQRAVGIVAPARNRPWLKTMDAFKLKGVGGGALGTRWLALDERGRRALLDGEVAATPGSAVGALFADGKPVRIDTIEWFASPADLVRVMDWLRLHSEAGPAAEVRRILAINPGVGRDVADRFAYLGYKGGSEPGVINMTLLLRTKGGLWRVLTAGWNDAAAPVAELRFESLMSRAAELAAAD